MTICPHCKKSFREPLDEQDVYDCPKCGFVRQLADDNEEVIYYGCEDCGFEEIEVKNKMDVEDEDF
jgi:DNA-directed RNA polymerase subunit RPC12/RpoP